MADDPYKKFGETVSGNTNAKGFIFGGGRPSAEADPSPSPSPTQDALDRRKNKNSPIDQ